MLFIGITGGVGSGKTAVLDYLRKDPLFLVSEADRIAEKLLKPGNRVFDETVRLLGEDILDRDGQIVRRRMADRIFKDPGLKDSVNSMIHPAVKDHVIREKKEAEASGKYEIYFLEAALLIECGYDKICDELWYIYADPEIRKKRLMGSRGYSAEKCADIMRNQLPDSVFREKCKRIIDNSGSFDSTVSILDETIRDSLRSYS